MMSLNTNAVITRTPSSSSPCGKKITAPATTPTVPTKVTVLGLIPHLRNRLASGAQTLVQNWRNLSSMAGSGYRVRHLVTDPEGRRRDREHQDRDQSRTDQSRRGDGVEAAGHDADLGGSDDERQR